jgi:hypothetical protein
VRSSTGMNIPPRLRRRVHLLHPTATHASDEALRRPAVNQRDTEMQQGAVMDKQQLEWLQCVCDYSDGIKGYGGYVTAGPELRAVDQSLRELGYIVGVANGALASVVTDAGRAALSTCGRADHSSASEPRHSAAAS